MIICIRCSSPTRPQDMAGKRKHCRLCQQRADRMSYYRHRFRRLEKINRRRAEHCGCQIGPVDYALIYAAQVGQPCDLCGVPVTPENYEFDHITPLALGGAHAEENMRIVHRYCNRAASMATFILARVFNRRT